MPNNMSVVPTKKFTSMDEYKATKAAESQDYAAQLQANEETQRAQQAEQEQVEFQEMQKINKEIPPEVLAKIQSASKTNKGEYTSPGSEFSPRQVVQELPGKDEGVNPLLQRDIGKQMMTDKFGPSSIGNEAEYEVFNLDGQQITNNYNPSVLDRSKQVISEMGASSYTAMQGVSLLMDQELGTGSLSEKARTIEKIRDLNDEQLKENIFSRELLVRNNTSGKIERKTYGDLASGANKMTQGLIESLPENVLIAIASMYTGGAAGAVAAGALSGGYYGTKTTASEYINLREQGYNKTTAFRAALAQGGTEGALESIAGAATSKMGSLGRKPGMDAVTEVGTEAAQQVGSNLINKSIGKDVDILDGAGEAGLMGGVSSLLIKSILGPIGKAKIKSRLFQATKGKGKESQLVEMAQTNPEILRSTLTEEYKLSPEDAASYVDNIIKGNPIEVKEEVVANDKTDVEVPTTKPKDEVKPKPEVVKTETVDELHPKKEIKPKEPKAPVTDTKVITKTIDKKAITELENSTPEFKELVEALDNKIPINKVKRSLITDENMKNYGILQTLRDGDVNNQESNNWINLREELKETGTITSGNFILAYDGDNVSIKPKKDKRVIPATIPMIILDEMATDKSIGTLYNDEIRGDARYFPKTKELEQALGGTTLTDIEKGKIRSIDGMASNNVILDDGTLSKDVVKALDNMTNKNLANLVTSMQTDPNYSPLEKVNIMNYNNERRGRNSQLTETDLPKGVKPDVKKTKKKDDDSDVSPPSSGGGSTKTETQRKVVESDSEVEVKNDMESFAKSTESTIDSAIKVKDGKSIGEVLNNLAEITKNKFYDYNSKLGKTVRRIYSKIGHLSRQLRDEFAPIVNKFVFNPKTGIVTALMPEGSGIDGSIEPVLKTVGDPITGVKVINEGKELIEPYSTQLDKMDFESVLSDESLSEKNRTLIIGLMNIKENSGLDIRVHNEAYMSNFTTHVKQLTEALNEVTDNDYNSAITEIIDEFKSQEVIKERNFINEVVDENVDTPQSIITKAGKAGKLVGSVNAKFTSPHHLFGTLGKDFKAATFDKYHTATNKYLYIKRKLSETLNTLATSKDVISEFKKYGSINLNDVVEGDIINSTTGKAYKDGDLTLTFDDLLSLYNFDVVQHINSEGLFNFRFPTTKNRVVSLNTLQLLDVMDKVEDVLKSNPKLREYNKVLAETNAQTTKTHNQYEAVRKLDATEKVGLLEGDYPIKVVNKNTGVGKSRHVKASSEQAKSMRNNYNFDSIKPEDRLFIIEPSSVSTNNLIERVARISSYEDTLAEIGGYMENAEIDKTITDIIGRDGLVEMKGWYEKQKNWYNGALGVSEAQQWYTELGQVLKSSFVRTNLTANPYVVAKQAASVETAAVAFSNIAEVNVIKTNLQMGKNTSLSTVRRTGVGVTNATNTVTSKSVQTNATKTNDFITGWYNQYAPQIQQRMENNGSYEMREIRENKKKGKGGIGAPLTKAEKAKKYTIGLGSDISDLGMKGITAVDMSVMDGAFITSMQITRDKYKDANKLVPAPINNLVNALASGVTVSPTVLNQINEYVAAHDEASIEFFKDAANLLEEVVIVSQPAIERHIGVGARDADGLFSWATMFGSQRTVTHAYTMELADEVYKDYKNGNLTKGDAIKKMLKWILVALVGGGATIGLIDETRDMIENSTSTALRDPKNIGARTISNIAGNNYVTGVGYRILEASLSNDRQFNANAVLDLTVPHLEPLINVGESLTDIATKGAGTVELAELAGAVGTIPTGLPIQRALKYLNLIAQDESLLSGAVNIAKIDSESDPVKRQDLVVDYITTLEENETNPSRKKKLKYQKAQAIGKSTRLKKKYE